MKLSGTAVFIWRAIISSVLILACPVLATSALSAKPQPPEYSKALLSAVEKSDLPAVQTALSRGASLSIRDENGRTPLLIALDGCNPSQVPMPIVYALLKKGAPVNVRDNSGTLALTYAINSGSLPAIRALIVKGANVNAVEQYGQTPLSRAAQLGNLGAVKLLLSAGAKAKPDKLRTSALSSAATYGYLEIARALIAKGASPRETDAYNRTVLMDAARANHAAVAKYLIEKGAEVNARDSEGSTALLEASMFEGLEATRVLLQNGANPNLADQEGSRPLTYAIIGSRDKMSIDLSRLLLEHGADPNLPDNEPPLVWAAGSGQAAIVRLLLAKGAKANGGKGRKPLLAVLEEGALQMAHMQLYAFGGVLSEAKQAGILHQAEADDLDVVRALLDHGVDVTDHDHHTTLIPASAGGNLAVVQLLLDKGAPVNFSDADDLPQLLKSMGEEDPSTTAEEIRQQALYWQQQVTGMTPLLSAAANGCPDVVQLLLERGANPMKKDEKGKTALFHVVAAGRTAQARALPRMREGILHRANEGVDKPVSKEVSPKEALKWRKWAQEGDSAIVRALLEKGADVNARDTRGNTALIEAAVNSSPAVVGLLLEAKATVDARDAAGQTALIQVVSRGRFHQAPEYFSQELKTSVMMAEKYANVRMGRDSKNEAKQARTALEKQKDEVFGEATRDDLAVLKVLLAHGANINERDVMGRTALGIARRTRYEAMVKWLKEAGAQG